MRTFFRFCEIIIVGILLTTVVLSFSITDVVLNKKIVKKELAESGIYSKFNDELKKDIKDKLKDEFDKDPEVRGKLNDIIDKTITVDVLEAETDDILNQVYNNSEKIEIDAGVLIDRYMNNFNKYISDNNIKLSSEINKAIEDLKNEARKNGKVNILEKDKDLTELVKTFYKYKDIVVKVRNTMLIATISLIAFSVLISKEKLKVIYKPLIFSGILLMIFRIGVSRLFNEINFNNIDEEAIKDLIITIKNTLLSNIDKYVGVFLIIGVVLMIVNIMISAKKSKNNGAENIQEYSQE